jgi:hypothetical protein
MKMKLMHRHWKLKLEFEKWELKIKIRKLEIGNESKNINRSEKWKTQDK